MYEYYRTVDEEGRPVVIEVDLDFEPVDDTVWMLWAFAPLQTRDEENGCSEEERQRLSEIKAGLSEVLELRNGALYAGMRLVDGWAELYFYAAWSKGAEQQFRDAFKRYGYERIEFGATRDTQHTFYRETLYPDAYELEQIKSREIIGELEEAGDNLAAVRPVEHYLFFQTEAAMQRCALALSESAESVETGMAEEGKYAYGLAAKFLHDCELRTLERVTGPLVDAALKEHGIYRGWSTVLAADH